MNEEKDFFKTCFNTVAGLEVKNESQAIAKEIVLSEIENLQEENKKYKEVIDKIQKHCEIEINASNHNLENYSSQQKLCHKVAHQIILDIIKEVSG